MKTTIKTRAILATLMGGFLLLLALPAIGNSMQAAGGAPAPVTNALVDETSEDEDVIPAPGTSEFDEESEIAPNQLRYPHTRVPSSDEEESEDSLSLTNDEDGSPGDY